jgi:hypothetical protein
MLNWPLIRWTFVCSSRHYLRAMLRKELVIPPGAAKAFVRDMKAYFKAKTVLDRDEIAGRQMFALRAFQRPSEKRSGFRT